MRHDETVCEEARIDKYIFVLNIVLEKRQRILVLSTQIL